MKNNEFLIQEPKRGWFKIISLLAALVAVIILTIGAYFLTKVNQAASSESVPVDFVVARGASTRGIAKSLSDGKIIDSYWGFVLYIKLHHASSSIQAGDYKLNRNMSIAQIVDVLTAGKVVPTDRQVTFVEGMTNKQLAANLESRNIVTAADFNSALNSAEFAFKYNDLGKAFSYQGFLFPDTYAVAKDVTAQQLIQKMLKNFELKITPQMVTDMNNQNLKIGDVIILSSIIEKEVGRNKQTITANDLETMKQERRLVASVFYNRLKAGMPLESDATVNYITGGNSPSVSIADTKIKSPYNTYQVKGLPPTPIANPGIDSIMAAIYPAQTDYLYFLSKPDGTAVFAKTLSEQNANKQKYLK